MITRLSRTDHPSVLFHLGGRERNFHFFISALESGEGCKLYSSSFSDGRTLYILVTPGFIVHLAGDPCMDGETADFINGLDWRILLSPSPLVSSMKDRITAVRDDRSGLMVLQRNRCPSDCRQARILKTPESFFALTDLYDRIEGYSQLYSGNRADFTVCRMEDRRNRRRSVAAIGGRRLISSATRSGDMIVSVCTDPEFRNRGYAAKVLRRLLNHAFSSYPGLEALYLFYSTDEAFRLYMGLGFEYVVDYDVLRR